MKNFLKALLTLILLTAFLLTGCETPNVSSENSSSDTSNTATHNYTNITDEVWQKIIDSQFADTSSDVWWKDTIKALDDEKGCFSHINLEELDYSRALVINSSLVEEFVGFNTIEEKEQFYNLLLDQQTLLVPLEKSPNNVDSLCFCFFNNDFSQGVMLRQYKSGLISNKTDDYFYVNGEKLGIYTSKSTWFELFLNENRKQQLVDSDLDLTKTTATQIDVSGLGYGFVFSDGEHEYFMRTNDIIHKIKKRTPLVETEYERLYSFDEVLTIIKNYSHFYENGYAKDYSDREDDSAQGSSDVISSVPDSSVDTSSERLTYSDPAEFAESDEAKDFVCDLGAFLGIDEVKSVEEYGVYPFAVYSTLIQVGDEAFDKGNVEIDMAALNDYLLKHFGSADFEIDNRLFWNQASNHPDTVYMKRSIEIDEYGLQIACGYTAEVIGVETDSEKAVYTLKLRDRFISPDITAVVKMTFEIHSEGDGYYYLKFLSNEVVESVYKNEALQSESSKQTAFNLLKTATENLNNYLKNGRIQINTYPCSSQLKINYKTITPCFEVLIDSVEKKACSVGSAFISDYFVFDSTEYVYNIYTGLTQRYKGDYATALSYLLSHCSCRCFPMFSGVDVADISVLSDTEDTLIIQMSYYDYELLSLNRLLYSVSPEEQDELLTDSVTTVTIDKKAERITRFVMNFELDAKVQELHNSEQYRYHMLVCDYGYDNIDLSDLELPS